MQLFNSLTRKKEAFAPLKVKKITLYVCGITPYDTTHLGHAFTYIWFDVLIRYLKFKGYEVAYTQNVTDINDRDNDILKKAKELNTTWEKLADFWTKKFLQEMSALNWIKPNNYIKASENLTSMIRIIELLLNKKLAYCVGSSVYLDVSKTGNFGKLSKLTQKQMLKIAKDFDEDVKNPDKRNPLDFTLWREIAKNQPPHIPSFKSPFGLGRPGWHIECSSMAISTLGDQIDIHGGGADLIFPHHEAEIAQSEGTTGKIPFVKYWLHTAQVSYKGKKMAKSLGNLVMISNLLKKFSANAIRWVLLSHHYREPWEFEERQLYAAESMLAKLKNVKDDCSGISKFISFMDNDLQANLVLKNLNRKRFLKILGFKF